jgi:hypothetical protein
VELRLAYEQRRFGKKSPAMLRSRLCFAAATLSSPSLLDDLSRSIF